MKKKLLTKEVTEDFWRDCLEMQDDKTSSDFISYKKYANGRNNLKRSKNNHKNYVSIFQNCKNKKNNSKYGNNNNNKTIDNESFMKVYKNHPILQENLETNIDKESDVILISVKDDNQPKILYDLQKKGYRNIILMTKELVTALR